MGGRVYKEGDAIHCALTGYIFICCVYYLLSKTTKLPLPDTSDAQILPNPNHIGSSTFLTDFVGQPTAYVLYLPYGVTESYEVKL